MKKIYIFLALAILVSQTLFGWGFKKAPAQIVKTQNIEKNITKERRSAVRNAWKQERVLVQETGQGTREWTRAEKKELEMKGKVKGYQGHHINNVKDHPEMAGDPNNIKFVRAGSEHLAEHHGNYRNATSGALIDRTVR